MWYAGSLAAFADSLANAAYGARGTLNETSCSDIRRAWSSGYNFSTNLSRPKGLEFKGKRENLERLDLSF